VKQRQFHTAWKRSRTSPLLLLPLLYLSPLSHLHPHPQEEEGVEDTAPIQEGVGEAPPKEGMGRPPQKGVVATHL